MANPIIKIKRGSTTPANGALAAGELAIDLTNLNLFVGKADGSALAVGGSGTFATKAYTDAAVSALGSSGGAALTQEIADRQAADTTLQNNIDTEKSRINAILSASTADKDSFAEIVELINSVDTENDTAFAGYVLSNDAALAQEVTDRTSADTALGDRIDGVSSDATALDNRLITAESDIVAEETARIAAVSAEASSRESADTTLQSNINAEATTRANADSALDTRVTALETTIDGGVY